MNIKVIGVDVYAEPTATLATLAGLAGYVAVDIDVVGLNLDPVFEGNIIEFANGMEKNYGSEVVNGELVTQIYTYPETGTTLAVLFPEVVAFRKNYVYLYSTEYNVVLASLTGLALNVVLEGYSTTAYSGGFGKQRKYLFHVNKKAGL